MKFMHRDTKLNAFTVFELTVVLALMSTIVTIIAVALNRFGEQLKNSSEMHIELNDWFAFRSNLWQELHDSDSVSCIGGQVNIYEDGKSISYRASGEFLERQTSGDWMSTGIAIENIEKKGEGKDSDIIFNFSWKGEVMRLSYHPVLNPKEIIDRYFEVSDE